VLEDGWRAEITAKNHLVLKRVVALQRTKAVGTKADPIMLEVFNNLFMSIAEQMGVSLQNTAYSVNIKERLDFSCAVFSADGFAGRQRAAHAGASRLDGPRGRNHHPREQGQDPAGRLLPDQRALQRRHPHSRSHRLHAGVRPRQEKMLFWVASRGHHADIGGIAPGSMSPIATSIEEEGIYIDNFKLVDRGKFREAALNDLLTKAKYPARNPLQNVNDLKAQIAANEKGVQELHKMVGAVRLERRARLHEARAGQRRRKRAPRHRTAARQRVQLRGRPGQCRQGQDHGRQEEARGRPSISPAPRRSRARTSTRPEPVTRAAVLYVFRVMVDDDIPMNAGLPAPINIIIPDNSMLRPHYPAAVVAGNVEVSQMVTDTLFGALGAMAGAQGTMNNVNFGNDTYQYYETICSGSPAGPGFPGTDAVHTHMTNTGLDRPGNPGIPYPVVLEDFHIRKGSGGKGKWTPATASAAPCGFLEKMEYTILSGHRRIPAVRHGRRRDGQIGENWVRRTTARWSGSRAPTRPWSTPAKPSSSRTPTAGGYWQSLKGSGGIHAESRSSRPTFRTPAARSISASDTAT
jgi:5-oxoprolinase (ATP-hydrolysing)